MDGPFGEDGELGSRGSSVYLYDTVLTPIWTNLTNGG